MHENKTPENHVSQPINIADVSRSVFFQSEKFYHKIWVNGDDHWYFKCQKITKEETLYPDAFGVGLYISPGGGVAQIYLSDYQCKFEGWEEITKDEFTAKTKDYISRAVSDFS